jgi:hypothetical protein
MVDGSSTDQKRRLLRSILLSIGVVSIVVDQFSVWWLSQHKIDYLTGKEFRFWPWAGDILSLILALILILYLFARQKENPGTILLLGGWLGNSIQRFAHGQIYDYIPLIWWRVNLSDLIIIGGILIYAFYSVGKEKTRD